jgi:hypothetical protein
MAGCATPVAPTWSYKLAGFAIFGRVGRGQLSRERAIRAC